MNVLPFQLPILSEYEQLIATKDEKTIDAYMRILRKFTEWLSERPGSEGRFKGELLTHTAVDTYIRELDNQDYSVSHRNRVKTVIGSFSDFLIEKGMLQKNPTRNIVIPPQPQLAPRILSEDQRYVMKNLVERDGTDRSAAIFALGYWAGCRPSDVTWLEIKNSSIGPKIGRIKVGYKANKYREIDLRNEVRGPLFDYLHGSERKFADSVYVFTSQRSDRLTESGLHQWFRKLKSRATKDEWDLIHDITFHDLRHDWAHRAREAGWSLEEIAIYLGHIDNKGKPAIQTTVRYTQPTQEQLRSKLKDLKG